MTDDGDRLQRLISAIAEGQPVDWRRESALTEEPGERPILEALELVGLMADLHRRGPDAPMLKEGQVVAHFQIIERIGAGARGEVYRARDTALNRDVALKILSPRDNEAPTPHLLEEARRLASLRHPNIVTVFGVETLEGRSMISMELLCGETLASLVRERGRFGPPEVTLIGLDLCRALAAVHHAGLLHQDVKAQNVMREEGGRIVLMDFGSRSATPLYMAPELFRGEPPTERSDIYSLGVLLYHLATGSFPIVGNSYVDLVRAHSEQVPTTLRDARPDLPQLLVQAIERALKPDAGARYQSAGIMERDLMAILGARPEQANVKVAAMPDPPGTSRKHRRPVLRAVIAGGISFAGLAALLFLTTRPGSIRHPTEASPGDAPDVAATSARVPPGVATLAFTVEADFYRGGGMEPLKDGARVGIGDSLSLRVRGSDSLYVYVIDEDDRGEAYLLFPLPNTTPQNPLPPRVTHMLPGNRGDDQFYWQVTTAGGREHFLIVASPERLTRFEASLSTLRAANEESGLQYVKLNETAMDDLRGVGAVVHGPKPPLSSPAELPGSPSPGAATLTSPPENARGVWVRTIEFINPG